MDFKPEPTIKLRSPDGREAIIDFGGEEITYSGNLPVSEGAKLFFDAVFKHFFEARKSR